MKIIRETGKRISAGLLIITMVLSVMLSPVPAYAANNKTGTYQVTVSSLRVRSGAGVSYPGIGFVKKGSTCTVTSVKKASNGAYWGQIQYGRKEGWISLSYCTRVSSEDTDSSKTSSSKTSSSKTSSSKTSYKVTNSYLRVRSGPGTSYKVLGTIHKGDIYQVALTKKASNGVLWGQITFEKETGWISLSYCTKVTENEKYASGSVVKTDGAASYQKTGSYLIGHRGSVSDGCERETTESFTKAGKQGFWGIEGDPRLYKGTLVMAHSDEDASDSSCTFEKYLDICKKYGCVAVIDIKAMGSAADDNLKLMVDIVKKKGMMDQAIFQCSLVKYLAKIRDYSSEAHLWLLVSHEDGMEKALENAKSVKAEGIDVNLECSGAADYIKAYKKAGYKTCAFHLTTYVTSASADFKTSGADYYMCDEP